MPTLEFNNRTGDGFPAFPLNVTTNDTAPSGAVEGMMALICVALT
jgi:hypothetical protein